MLQRVLLAVFLVGVLVWTITCGRSRTPPASDTPVPTLTPLPIVAATATQTATAVPMETPTEEATDEATEEVTVEAAATEETVTSPGSASISATEEVTASVTVISTPTVAPTATERPTNTPVPTATARATATPPPTSTPSPIATATPTSMPTQTAVVEPSPTATATAAEAAASMKEVSATAMITSAEISVDVEVTSAISVTATNESSSTPATAVRARSPITLPADLATSVQITGVTLLTDLVADALPMVAELSPDGNSVAWLVPEQARRLATLCIASISGGGQNCFSAEGYRGMPYRLVWSPDSLWLAFSEDSAAQALESDIWLFDVAQGELTNRSDDQAAGRYAEVASDFALDYLPMWEPSTGYLYFWRSTPDAQGGFMLDLMRLDPATDDTPELVRSLGQSLGDGLVRFGWQRFYLQGPSTIAPDGSQVAVSIAPAQEMDVSSGHVLWLIDLWDAEAEPRQVATALAWQSALPQWSNQPAVARGLQWTADGKGIVVAALSSDLRLPLLLAYYVDVASGDVTSVVDFSDSRDRDAFFRLDPTTGHARRFDVPWTVALAPDANMLLMVTDLGGGVRVLGVPLPPTEGAPTVLHEHRSPGYEAWTRNSSGAGKVLVYGLLMESVPLE